MPKELFTVSQANRKLFNLSHPGSNGSLVTALSVLLGVSVSLTLCKCSYFRLSCGISSYSKNISQVDSSDICRCLAINLLLSSYFLVDHAAIMHCNWQIDAKDRKSKIFIMDESETRRDILEKKKLTEILSENNFLFFKVQVLDSNYSNNFLCSSPKIFIKF